MNAGKTESSNLLFFEKIEFYSVSS